MVAFDLPGTGVSAVPMTADGGSHGMAGIIDNACGLDDEPTADELSAVLAPFSLRPLLDQDRNAPMLVINGADDVHVARDDTLVFDGCRHTEVHLLPNAGHCAPTELATVFGLITGWLGRVLSEARGA